MADSSGSLARRASTGLVVATVFLTPAVNGLYGGLGREMPEAFPTLATFLMSASFCAWFWSYCRDHRIAWPMDMGWLVFAAWIFVVPYFILRAEGRRGLARIALFCFTYCAALLVGWATLIWARLIAGAE